MSFNILEFLIGIIFLIWIFSKEKKLSLRATRYSLPVALILLGLALSVIANKNYLVGLGAMKGWFVFPIVFGIIFFEALKKDESFLKKSLLALFFSGVAVSIVGIVYKFLENLTYDGRLKIFWDSPNQLAMFLAIPFLIGLFFVLREKEISKKRFYILGLSLVGLSLYYSFSYGAWLAITVAIIVFFWLKYRSIAQKRYVAIFLVFLLFFLGWASFSKLKNIQNLGERSSLASRFVIWKSAGLMIKNNSLFGVGAGNFQNKYLEYQKYFPPYLEWSAPQPHNIFLAFWLESGLAGLVGFIILLFYFFRDNKKAIINNRDFGILFFGIMAYILVHGLIDTTYWRNDLAVVFWVVIAANLHSKEKRD
ncbi:MAG: O-antigen ligase family protein [Parcubacteria group bacterium]